jgi:hypothetical protein
MTTTQQQEKRRSKLYTDEFYLLQYEPDESVIHIVGSTRTIYKVMMKKGKLLCSCPDAKSHARHHGVYCKHVCFIYEKLGKFTDMGFYDRKVLSEEEWESLETRLIERMTGYYYDDIAAEEKQEMADIYEKYTTNHKCREVGECPICYDDMTENIVYCLTCGNPCHMKCMKKWLEMGKEVCVYCKSSCWREFAKLVYT